MKKTIDKTKWLDYTIPSTGEEIGWMAFIVYRDKKDNHKHLIVPWERAYSITPKDSAFLKRIGKKIVKAIRECQRDEKMRRNKKSPLRTRKEIFKRTLKGKEVSKMAKKTNAKTVKAPDMGYVFNRDGSCEIVVEGHNIRKMPEEVAKAICDKYHGRTK